MDQLIDHCIKECLGDKNSPINKTLQAVFNGVTRDMKTFLHGLFCSPSLEGVSATTTSPPSEIRCLVIHPHQKLFRMIFLKHARNHGLEATVQEGAPEEEMPSTETPDKDFSTNVTEPKIVKRRRRLLASSSGSSLAPPPPPSLHNPTTSTHGNEQRLKQLMATKLFRVKFLLKSTDKVITREYRTGLSVRLVCATLMDPMWHGKCVALSDIPHLILWSLLSFHNNPKPREFIQHVLLDEQTRSDFFVGFQLQYPDELMSYRLEILLEEKAQDELLSSKRLRTKMSDIVNQVPDQDSLQRAEEILKTNSHLDPDLMTLTAYLYFRFRTTDLRLPYDAVKTYFSVITCIFEEYGRSVSSADIAPVAGYEPHQEQQHYLEEHQVPSALDVMSTASKAGAKIDISKSSIHYARILEIASELCLFMHRRAQGDELLIQSRGEVVTELDQQSLLRMSILQRLYVSMGRVEDRLQKLKVLEDLKQENLMGERKQFFWAKSMQTPWKGMVHDLSRRLHSFQANALLAFGSMTPNCVVFAVEQGVSPQSIHTTFRHFNRKYPSLRLQVLKAVSDNTRRGVPVRLEISNAEDIVNSSEDAPELPAYLFDRRDSALVISDGSMCFVAFSSPAAHQRLCSYSVMETLTTMYHQKFMPYYSILIRLYTGVFSNYEQPCGQVPDEDVENRDDYENLWIVVNTLFYQLCRYSSKSRRRMVEAASKALMDRNHKMFRFYRWMHWICERLDDYMECFPFFKVCGEEESGAGLKDRHQALSNTCDIILCFLCLRTTHTLTGTLLARMLAYLEDITKTKALGYDTHSDLLLYLRHLKRVFESEPSLPQMKEGVQQHLRLSFYPDEVQTDGLHRQSELFKELLFDLQHRDRDRVTWINILFYAFCTDKRMDLKLCGDVLFEMDYDLEKLDRKVYWKHARRDGSDRDAVKTGTRKQKRTTPSSSAAVSMTSSRVGTPIQHASPFSSIHGTPISAPASPFSPPQTPTTKKSMLKSSLREKKYSQASWRNMSTLDENLSEEDEEGEGGEDQKRNIEKRISTKALLLRRQDRENRVGYGHLHQDRTQWKNTPYKDNFATRSVYYGLREISSNPQLYVACMEYSVFFCWPKTSIKFNDEEDQEATELQPPGPIYYLKGTEFSDQDQFKAATSVGTWRYETLKYDKEERFDSFSDLLRELEWMLYYRNYDLKEKAAQSYKIANGGNCYWRIRTDDFVRKHINSRLPVDYRELEEKDELKCGEFICLEDSLWILKTEEVPDQELLHSSSSTSASAATTANGAGANTSGPSDSELRYLCKEHSGTFAYVLGDIENKADSIDSLPLVEFIRSCLVVQQPTVENIVEETEELLDEGLVLPQQPPPPLPLSTSSQSSAKPVARATAPASATSMHPPPSIPNSKSKLPSSAPFRDRSLYPDVHTTSESLHLSQKRPHSPTTPPRPPPNSFNRYVARPEPGMLVPSETNKSNPGRISPPRMWKPSEYAKRIEKDPQFQEISKRFMQTSNDTSPTSTPSSPSSSPTSSYCGAPPLQALAPEMQELFSDVPMHNDPLDELFDGPAQHGTMFFWQNEMKNYWNKAPKEVRPEHQSVKEFKDRLEKEGQFKRGVGDIRPRRTNAKR